MSDTCQLFYYYFFLFLFLFFVFLLLPYPPNPCRPLLRLLDLSLLLPPSPSPTTQLLRANHQPAPPATTFSFLHPLLPIATHFPNLTLRLNFRAFTVNFTTIQFFRQIQTLYTNFRSSCGRNIFKAEVHVFRTQCARNGHKLGAKLGFMRSGAEFRKRKRGDVEVERNRRWRCEDIWENKMKKNGERVEDCSRDGERHEEKEKKGENAYSGEICIFWLVAWQGLQIPAAAKVGGESRRRKKKKRKKKEAKEKNEKEQK